MTHIPDLSPCTYFGPVLAAKLTAVGWLSGAHEFPTSQVPNDAARKLEDLAKEPWQPFFFMGLHECDLPNCSPRPLDTWNLFIPATGTIYAAPRMVLHYIQNHGYQPPDAFISAVRDCPEMNSTAYKEAIKRIADGAFDARDGKMME